MKMFLRLVRVLLTARFRPAIGAFDTATTTFRVHPGDLDAIGHMNNGTYLTIADLGRVDLMARSGLWAAIRTRRWYPVVAAQTVSYQRSLTLGQRFQVHTTLLGTDGHSVFIEQVFRQGGRQCARVVVRGRFRKRAGGTVAQHELDDVVGGFPADRVLPTWVVEWARATRPAPVVDTGTVPADEHLASAASTLGRPTAVGRRS